MILRISRKKKHTKVSFVEAVKTAKEIKDSMRYVLDLYCPVSYGEDVDPLTIAMCFEDLYDISKLYSLLFHSIFNESLKCKFNETQTLTEYFLLTEAGDWKYSMGDVFGYYKGMEYKYNTGIGLTRKGCSANVVVSKRATTDTKMNKNQRDAIGEFGKKVFSEKDENEKNYAEWSKKEFDFWRILDIWDQEKINVLENEGCENILELISGTGEMICRITNL